MTTILIVLQVILSISIVIVVLLQKSSSIGLGAYSGSNESLFGAKGPANFMAKITMLLGVIFLINTIALGYLYNTKTAKNKSVIDGMNIPKALPLTPTDNSVPLSSPLLNGGNQSNTIPLMQGGDSPLQNTTLPTQNSLESTTQ
ncbi:preprotein translocase subunit SecG [Helicobacter didelphidarum]|uniref:Protein-export membrane protein SecG n=1 Tax=Helicobacter didelphidarum TaxID=2040648 RepID=A0A3D8IJQ8_9HELI|nr:preprotein translocase subunit SecG [Helicobacter didelphidarum]